MNGWTPHFGWPQIIWCVMVLYGLANELSKNGKPRTGNHDAGVALIATCLLALLLWWGGFFG
jgi:hypothetical protein